MFLIRDFFATSSLKIVNSIAQWGSKNGRDIYVTRPNNPSTRVTNANSLFEWFGRAVIAFPAQKKDPPMRKGLWKPREADITGGKYLWMGKAEHGCLSHGVACSTFGAKHPTTCLRIRATAWNASSHCDVGTTHFNGGNGLPTIIRYNKAKETDETFPANRII